VVPDGRRKCLFDTERTDTAAEGGAMIAGGFRFFLLSVLSVSAVALGTFYCGVFIPSVALFAGLFFAVLIELLLRRFSPRSVGGGHWKEILLLILCCLIFRAEPFLYLLGGQDQGVYVNMAAYYSREGGPFIRDAIPERLRDRTAIKAYTDDNHTSGVVVRNEAEGNFLPGVYIRNLQKSEYVFQFFHLHPLLMAVAGWLFGMGNMVWSLVLLSIGSVVALYLLTYEISGSKTKAMAVGLLLAFSPLHAFFSKFPVTENVALFFSAGGFYFLARFWKRGEDSPAGQAANLAISAASMAGLFFTRISGFMYVPFFLFLGFLALVHPLPDRRRRMLLWYVAAVCGLCALSLLQGLRFSFPYTREMLRKSFSRLLGGSWESLLPQLLVLGGVLFASGKLPFVREMWRRLFSWLNDRAAWFFVLLFAAGGYRIYTLAFTPAYEEHSWIGQRWGMAAQGLESVKRTSFWVTVQYLSPFLFVLFLTSLLRKRNRDAVRGALLFFLLSFWGYILLLQWTIPYQYYYARYILSEVLPYTVLFAVLYAWEGPLLPRGPMGFRGWTYGKLTVSVLLFFSMVYSVSFSATQLGRREVSGVRESLDRVAGQFGRDDIVFLVRDGLGLHNEIKTSLMFYYNKNVATTRFAEVPDSLLKVSITRYHNTFLLVREPGRIASEWEYMGQYSYNDSRFEYARDRIPSGMTHRNFPLSLYRLDAAAFLKAERDRAGKIETRKHPDRSGFHEGDIWTRGSATFFNLDFPLNGRRVMVLLTKGWRPDREDIESLDLFVEVDGHAAELLGFGRNAYRFLLPSDTVIERIDSVTIRSSTFVPRETGISDDGRALGMDIDAILFERLPE